MPTSKLTVRRARTAPAPVWGPQWPAGTQPDWFSEHAPAWEAMLLPRLRRRRAARCLFVGPHDGRCVAWLMGRLGPDARATVAADSADLGGLPGGGACVGYLGRPAWVEGLKATFDANVASFGPRVALLPPSRSPDRDAVTGQLLELAARTARASARARATSARAEVGRSRSKFDFAYVDCQSSRQAMELCVLALPLLKPGGLMVLTNYVHGRNHDAACPRRGIDGFLDAYVGEVRVLRSAFHLFLERRARPLPPPLPCRAEAFDGREPLEEPRCNLLFRGRGSERSSPTPTPNKSLTKISRVQRKGQNAP